MRGRRGRGLPPGLAPETKGARVRGGMGGLPDHPGAEFRPGPVQSPACGRPLQLCRVASVGARACGRTGVALRSRASIRTTSVAMVAVAALGLSAMSWFQCATWRHSLELWSHALEVGSDRSLEAHGNFAQALSKVGLEAEALEQYQAAVRVAPRSSKAACIWPSRWLARGRIKRRSPRCAKRSRLHPTWPMMHYYLGSFLVRLGQRDQAEVSFREAIRLGPGFCDAHRDLGALLAAQGQNDEARYHLETALQIRPNDPVARSNLERFLARQENAHRADKQPPTIPAALPPPKVSSQLPAGNATSASPTLMDTSRIKR